jgi:type VI secretion system protein ImpK
MDAAERAAADHVRACFNAVNQLRALGPDTDRGTHQRLHARIVDLIDRLQDDRKLELSDRDARDVAYALVALADEIGVGQAGRAGPETAAQSLPGDAFWRANLLQMRFFDENIAGENFFRRLETLRRDHRRVPVLRVYYLCLLFGFQGIYVGREASELRRLTESVGRELAEALALGAELSPDGERPDEAMLRRRHRRPLLLAGLAAFAAAACLAIGLKITLDDHTEALARRLTAAAAPAQSNLAGPRSPFADR